jgi:non-ribosomal peptide synthetase component F
LKTYEQLLDGEPLQMIEEDRFEDYIHYIEACDKEKEEAYWKEYLRQLSKGSLLPFIGTKERNKGMGTYGEELMVVNKELTKKLQAFAREHRLTINTIMQGVWSYLLYRYTGNPGVVYGVTVSGRPEALAGVEKRVGMYINTLPLHTTIQQDQLITNWLQKLQEQQLQSREFQHSSLTSIQEWTGVKGELFDTILVFENYPVAKLIAEKQWKLQVEQVQVQEDTNYPLCIGIGVGEEVFISFKYNAALLSNADVKQIRSHFEQVLYAIMQPGQAETRQLEIKIESSAVKTEQPRKEDLFNFETDLSLA